MGKERIPPGRFNEHPAFADLALRLRGRDKGAHGVSGTKRNHRMHDGVLIHVHQIAGLGTVSATRPAGGNRQLWPAPPRVNRDPVSSREPIRWYCIYSGEIGPQIG